MSEDAIYRALTQSDEFELVSGAEVGGACPSSNALPRCVH